MADPTTTTEVAHQASGGLPQFDPGPWPSQIFWSLLIFGVLYLLISRVFAPRIISTIDAREDRIAGDIGDARRARDAAQADLEAAAREMAAARNRAKQVALEAQNEAKAASAARQAEEDARIAKAMEEAEARIAAARADAMSHVRSIAVDTAQAMIHRLTGAAVDAAEIEAAMARVQG
jgi:F-type H+-transporting ATPase subunit b